MKMRRYTNHACDTACWLQVRREINVIMGIFFFIYRNVKSLTKQFEHQHFQEFSWPLIPKTEKENKRDN